MVGKGGAMSHRTLSHAMMRLTEDDFEQPYCERESQHGKNDLQYEVSTAYGTRCSTSKCIFSFVFAFVAAEVTDYSTYYGYYKNDYQPSRHSCVVF